MIQVEVCFEMLPAKYFGALFLWFVFLVEIPDGTQKCHEALSVFYAPRHTLASTHS